MNTGDHFLFQVLLGFRLMVYRAEGTTQWFTAVTTGYNDDTGVSSWTYIVVLSGI